MEHRSLFEVNVKSSITIQAEEFASVCHEGSPAGKLVIDVMMSTITPAEARRLAKWLLKAADHVVAENRPKAKVSK